MNSVHQGEKWFKAVEIEINSHCNRRCSYCPVSFASVSEKLYMSSKIFHTLIEQLSRVNYGGRVTYNIYNEPLLNKNLEDFARRVKESLPKTRQILFTNGDLLSDHRYHSLLESGIDHFLVTKHDLTSIPERPHQTVRYFYEIALNNRGGVISELSEPLVRPCFAPMEMLIVSVSGNIQLCCNDGQKTAIMGNIMETDLQGIWFSDTFQRIRNLLAVGDRKRAGPICSQCNSLQFCSPGEAETPSWLVEST